MLLIKIRRGNSFVLIVAPILTVYRENHMNTVIFEIALLMNML